MNMTLGLLPDSPASDEGDEAPSNGSTTVKSMLTKEDNNNNNNSMVMCSEVTSSSSSYPVGDQNMDGLELGLGLSIGWSQYARILTAKDFPTKQNYCSVSVTKSSSSGIKRTAIDFVSPSNGNSVVGWPPVSRAHRMPSLANEIKSPTRNLISLTEQNRSKSRTIGIKECSNERNRSSDKKYRSVKVNMDGTLIGRKVDLNAHSSYEMLAQTLEEMFFRRRSSTEPAKSSRLLDGTSEFVLTYEDKDGDCMLVGDVPWQMFLTSVNRLRIMKNSESNELAPRSQENNERQRTNVV